jgi:hypothetical protein
MPPEPVVEGDGFGEVRDIRADFMREPPAAGDGRDYIHAHGQCLAQRRKDAK